MYASRSSRNPFGPGYHDRRTNSLNYSIRSSVYRKELFSRPVSNPARFNSWHPSMEMEERPRARPLEPRDKKPTKEKKEKTMKKLIHNFMGYTTAHGIGRLGDAKNIFWKLFWTAVCMGAFGMFIFQVWGLFKLYFSKPVSTSVKITFEKKLSFPAVTLCNMNMLRRDAIPEAIKARLQTKAPKYNEWSTDSAAATAAPEAVKRERRHVGSWDSFLGSGDSSSDLSEEPEVGEDGAVRLRRYAGSGDSWSSWSRDYGGYNDYTDYAYDADGEGSYYSGHGEDISEEYPDAQFVDEETRLRIEMFQIVGETDINDLYYAGHTFYELVENCTWKGLDCRANGTKSKWVQSWNHKYGNCYTFNSGFDSDGNVVRVLSSSKPGPSQGLVLTLNVQQEEYIGPLTIEAGVRVLLHAQGEMPFPLERGFSVSPSMATSVGMKKIQLGQIRHRADKIQNENPSGHKMGDFKRKTKIVRLDRFKNNSCLQTDELEKKNIYRMFRNITVYSQQACLNSCLGSSQFAICKCSEITYPSKAAPCDIFNTSTAGCLKYVKRLFNDDKLKCLGNCRQPCTEEVIQKTISTTQWPSKSYKAYLASKGQSFNQTDNLLSLNIFYNELNYEKIEEKYSYGNINLLADIGGQLGLWIGISALTVCELMELFMKIFSHFVRKCHGLNDVEEVVPPYGYN